MILNHTLMRDILLGKNPDELKEAATEAGLPGFTGAQLSRWLYVSKARTFDEMTNISKSGREKLKAEYDLGVTAPSDCQVSSDGTKKYLFPVGQSDSAKEEGNFIESVMIPEDDRKTLCVSSQAGCRMGCKFCMTGRQGFHGQLTPAEILSQFITIDEYDGLTNAVFMGMGEPLDNYVNVKKAIEVLTADWGFAWSPKRITLSTIGVMPALKRYLDETRCHLAVSLHNPFPDERAGMMPAEKAYPIEETVDLIREYDFTGQRRVSFEYIMFYRMNDDKRHADALIRLLKGLECRVNLIRFHKIPDAPFEPSPQGVMEIFRDRLSSQGITCTIRASRGEDILAACGMLAGKHKDENL